MRRAGWAALALAGVFGAAALVSTYLVPWNANGPLSGLILLLPVAVAFVCGLAWRREVGVIGVLWMTGTSELFQGYVNPFLLVVTLGPWLVGTVVRDRRQITQRLSEVGRELEAESQRLADEAIRLERARIARELHDIVAHCVSVMVVQAYAGERLAPFDQSLATEALDHIAEAAAQAKQEIAHLVDLLADQPATRLDRELGPSLRDLVARAAATGLDIRLRVAGRPERVPPAIAAVAFRVVQESVTNALKHAPGAPIDISVDCGDDVVIDVVNATTPTSGSHLAASGGGYGLAGIRERVTGLGGQFAAGADEPATWRVSVRLPPGSKGSLAD